MRCKQCNYRLWNLTSRHCPECSTTFAPTDYHFKPGAVEFCCPHCMHIYFGSMPHGHLDPIDFDCTNCGKHVHMNDMLLRPVRLAQEALIASQPNPWTRQPQQNKFMTLMRTIHLSQYQPHLLMDGTPTQGGSLDALAFASTIVMLICGMGLGLPVIIISLMHSSDTLTSLVYGVTEIGILGLFILAGLLITSVVTHGLLKITGGTRHNLSCTFNALAYATGPLAWLGIPFCNGLLLFVVLPWYYINASIALVRMQHVNPGRVLVCLMVVPVIVFILIIRMMIFR